MAKASDNQFPSVLFTEQGSAPTGPAAGYQRLFIDSSDHHLKRVDSADAVVDLEEAGATIATDTIWDAAGDLAYGTGADTAARLALGTAGQTLRVNSGATAPEWASVGRVLISEQTSDGDESSITFGSIPAGYRNLYIEWVARSQRGAAADSSLHMQFNGDTTAGNYRRATIVHYGTTVTYQAADDAIVAYLPAATAPANSAGAGSMHIKAYAGTTFLKVREGRYAYRFSAGSGNEMILGQYGGEWENAAAITQIVLLDGNSANFVSGSVFRLYGEY